MTSWRHEVSVDWLNARRDVITATELISLRSGFSKLTKAQKAGAQVAPAFAALWGLKHSVMDPDPASYGPAARGHFLELYAISDYIKNTGESYFHWDDCIICNNGLGFSPDATNLPQPYIGDVVRLDVKHGSLVGESKKRKGFDAISSAMPTSILEIKSYGIENHMKNLVTPDNALKERYQIAAAMMVIPTLEEGKLVQYCPQLESFSMFCRTYSRDDLEDEILNLSEILDVWNKTCKWFECEQPEMTALHSEHDIIRDYEELSQDPVFRLG